MATIPSRVQAGQFGPVNPAGRRRQLATPIVLIKGTAQGLEQTRDRQQNALQQRVADSTQAARANPLGASNFIQNVTFSSSTPTVVQHGLGRAFVSALVTGQSVVGEWSIQRASAVTRPPSLQNALDTREVSFVTNFSGVADVLVW